ncbi:MAG: insulinase family protein, partial [Pirellulales bacterium]|nr:insulinase family protein [Pirellulales bacterium]
PNLMAAEVARYENVTKADVMRVYNEYVKEQPAVVLSVVPQGQGDAIARPDTWQRYERHIPEYTAIDDAQLDYRVAVDNFDRSQVPPAGPTPSTRLPEIWRASMPNGIEILGTVNDEVPTTTIQLRIKTGQRNESLDKLGVAQLTAAMLNEQTKASTREELSNALKKLGSQVAVAAGDDYTTMSLRALTSNLDATLAIAAEKLLEPKFDADDFARLQAQTIEGIRQADKDAGTVADRARGLLLYGSANAFAHPNTGTVDSVGVLSVDDVRAFYASNYSPSIADMIVVSDLGADEILDKLQRFERWMPKAVSPAPMPAFPARAAGTLYFIDKPGAAQSEIRITKRALPYDATGEYYRANLTVFPLGGNFNSRINQNLREDKGYTYGARAGFGGNAYAGSFTASAAVRTDATLAAIEEFVKEISVFGESGMSLSELAFTQSAMGQRDARAYETPSQKAGLLSQMLTYGLDEGFIAEQQAILEAFSVGESQAIAAEHLNLEDMIVIVVGDRTAVFDDLTELGWPIVELDGKSVSP